MRLAVKEGQACEAVPTAYNVGAVLVAHVGALDAPPSSVGDAAWRLSYRTGHSREAPGNTHAEQVAIAKWATTCMVAPHSSADAPRRWTLYTTMEPCSKRLSGLQPCTDRFLAWLGAQGVAAAQARVVVGVREPSKFVRACKGIHRLQSEGIDVVCYQDVHEAFDALPTEPDGSDDPEGRMDALAIKEILDLCRALNEPCD